MSKRRVHAVHLVDLERHRVGFEGLFVVVFPLLYEGPDVPTYVRLEVFAHAILDQSDACFALAEVDDDEALHAHGFYRASDEKGGSEGRAHPHAADTF